MAHYALVEGELVAATELGMRGRCYKGCLMIAKPGNGQVVSHWAHEPGSDCPVAGTESSEGDWHKEVKMLFEHFGAQPEVPGYIAANGRLHRADVVLADGRVVEVQTKVMSEEAITSRETTYGDMCWIYDARYAHEWFNITNPSAPHVFRWATPQRALLAHQRPIYLDCGADGVWRLDAMKRDCTERPTVYSGWRTRVASDLLEFVKVVSAGAVFGAPPLMQTVGERHQAKRFAAQLMDVETWMSLHQTCHRPAVEWATKELHQGRHEERLRDARLEVEQAQRLEMEMQAARLEEEQASRLKMEVRARLEAAQHRRLEMERLARVDLVATITPLPAADFTDWSKLQGMRCSCGACTSARWGDLGGCKSDCVPCALMNGTVHTSHRQNKANAA